MAYFAYIAATVAFGMETPDWPPTALAPAFQRPAAGTELDEWIGPLLHMDVRQATLHLKQRLRNGGPELEPLRQAVEEFVPYQCAFSKLIRVSAEQSDEVIGHIRLVRHRPLAQTEKDKWRAVFIAQPLPRQSLDSRVQYFEEPLRPLMRRFFERYAGFGDEMSGHSGQFMWDDESFENFNWEDTPEVRPWTKARVLYVALNGDTILISQSGETVWHVFDSNEIVHIADNFPTFVTLYSEFLSGPIELDAYTWQDFEFRSSSRTKR